MQTLVQPAGGTALPRAAAPWWRRAVDWRAAWRLASLRGLGTRGDGGLTALMFGAEQVLAVCVQPPAKAGALPRLSAAAELPLAALATLRNDAAFDTRRALLVLGQSQRQLIAMERPEVPDEELALAVRFPLAEALEQEPDQVLATALALPRISEAGRDQVLAVGAALPAVREQLATLRAAGIVVRSIDVADSALRGMALLRARADARGGAEDRDGHVVLAFIGRSICIGLLWRGAFCALRSLPLPVREPRDAAEFEEQLALHIQRTTDQFERQATQLAVRHVLASMPSLPREVRESVRGSLPLAPRLFEIDEVFDAEPAAAERVAGHNDLAALACVAAARLLDAGAPGSGRAGGGGA